jgi:DNA-binding NarL/FixJ family response regulator
VVTCSFGRPLTRRQEEILARVARGETNKEIARALGITEGAVKLHVRKVLRKLGAANRTQAAAYAHAGALAGTP